MLGKGILIRQGRNDLPLSGIYLPGARKKPEYGPPPEVFSKKKRWLRPNFNGSVRGGGRGLSEWNGGNGKRKMLHPMSQAHNQTYHCTIFEKKDTHFGLNSEEKYAC
jgi:hypothetical protein